MGRGGFNGGSTILGGGGRASGWSSFDPAEYRPEVRERPAKNGPQIIKNHTREVDVLDYLIDQKFRKVEQLKLNKNIDPKLKKIIERFSDSYEWAKKHPLFKERFPIIKKRHDKPQDSVTKKVNIDENLEIKKKITWLEKKRERLKKKIAGIDSKIIECQMKLSKE